MTATNLKAYLRPPEEHTPTTLNGYFPCELLVFYDLVATAQIQLSACHGFRKNKCIFSAHTKRMLNAAVKVQPEILHDVFKEKSKNAHRTLNGQTKTGSPEGFDY